ncbi:hypothetical protein PTKIN_Ptkin19aG0070400 [Pterospermum kingtungense]
MASKLQQLQSKACQASKFVAKHGTAYYKQLLEQNKQYIQEPPTVEKCSELSKQLFYTRLASIPGRTEAFWKELDYFKNLWKNRQELKVEDAGIAALFGMECFAWFCAGVYSDVLRSKEDYNAANVPVSDQVWDRSTCWKAHPAGMVKLTVDAAFSASREEASLGLVARDSSGEVLFSAAEKRWSISSSLPICKGLSLAKEFDFQLVNIESDCLLAINEINRNASSFSECGRLVLDLDILEATQAFMHCSFLHIRREENRLANFVAKAIPLDFLTCNRIASSQQQLEAENKLISNEESGDRMLAGAIISDRTRLITTFSFIFLVVFADSATNNSQVKCSRTCVAENCNSVGIRYGKYCGVGWSGCPGEKPCDDLDACCKIHDECVEKKGPNIPLSSFYIDKFTNFSPVFILYETAFSLRWFDNSVLAVVFAGLINVKCHEKFKSCMKKVQKSGKTGFSRTCPIATAVPTMMQGMDMAILLSQFGGNKFDEL